MDALRMTAPRKVGMAILAFAAALANAVPLAAQAGGERLFYYVDRLNSFESLQNHIDQIDVLAPQSYKVDADGVVWGEVDPRVLRLAREHDVPVMPLIVNPGFDADLLHSLLSDEAARRRTIETLVALCHQYGFSGIQFDFENLHLRDREAFTRFYRETADALHAGGYKLSVAVVHRLDDYPGPTAYHGWLFEQWRAGYDLQALGEIGDFISVMSYSQHTRRTPPGPAAGLPWVRHVIEYFLRHVPAEKLSMGIPLWSMHWYTSWEEDLPERARSYSRSFSYPEAIGLLERHATQPLWSEDQQVPYAFFSNGGVFEWVFLEDVRSFSAKLDLVNEYGLLGFSAWVLGSEDPDVWGVLNRARM